VTDAPRLRSFHLETKARSHVIALGLIDERRSEFQLGRVIDARLPLRRLASWARNRFSYRLFTLS
jgi:hypothetical protein